MKTGKVECQKENKTESRENQGHHILLALPRQKFRTHSKTVWRETQNLSSSKFFINYFRLQIHFPKIL